MIFAIGTRVSFLHSGENGVIKGILGDNMVNVLLDDDDMEIPVHIEDLLSLEAGQTKKKQKTGPIRQGRYAQKPSNPVPPKKPLPKRPVEIHAKREAGQREACLLAFVPQKRSDSQIYGYELHLVNHSAHTLVYEFTLNFHKRKEHDGNGKLSPYSFTALCSMDFLQLNDAPSFDFTSKVWTTEDREKWVDKRLKIKGSSFFKKEKMTPLLQKMTYLYVLRESFFPKENTINLKDYTKNNAKSTLKPKEQPLTLWGKVLSPNEVAAFPSELDLHIEKLSPKHARLNNREIIDLQLRSFDTYMRKAIRSGVTSVLIIHGKGTGRLKSEILYRLNRFPEVSNIEEGHKDGGATQVRFG